jgi:membrane-associated phospholipid phosphatase
MDAFLHGLTDLGDSAITLPIAAVVLIWLAIWGNRRVALTWLVVLIACGAVTAALKIYFKACPLPGIALDSPSGHTSMSLYVYGGLTMMTAAQLRAWRRNAAAALGALLIGAITVTRVTLNFHSKAEVVIGLTIGGIALAWFAAAFRRSRPAPMPLWPSWIAILIPIALLSGHSISGEDLLGRIALYIGNVIDFCV